jgi:predicted anti-sigma-YlaC factor YlaD
MHYNNMSECKWIRKRLSEYIDGELSQESRLRVLNHLSSCEPCSKELSYLCNSISIISQYDSEQMPEVIRTFHLPRSSFIEVFPSIREEKPTITSGILVPYLSACVLFLMVITATITLQHHFLPAADPQYNPSNFVQVFGE